MPYDPLANPYIINPKELPSNQTAAAAVPAKNIGTANQWCQSPYYTPNWHNSLGAANTPPWTPTAPVVATASVGWPDATIEDRDLAANAALNLEKTRLNNGSTTLTAAITAINNLTGGAPGVAVVIPALGLAAGGTAVVIEGSGFTGATGATFGGTAATGFSVTNDGEIKCTVPAHAVGAVNVAVTTPAGTGTLSNGFTYQ